MVRVEALLRGVGRVQDTRDYILLSHVPGYRVPADVTALGAEQDPNVHDHMYFDSTDIGIDGHFDIVYSERCCKLCILVYAKNILII